jgi:hypothetical protein
VTEEATAREPEGVGGAEAGIKAQYEDNQNVFDNVWKDIKEEAQVTSEFVRANHDLLVAAVQGREGGAGERQREHEATESAVVQRLSHTPGLHRKRQSDYKE